jgi:hypothetical protein
MINGNFDVSRLVPPIETLKIWREFKDKSNLSYDQKENLPLAKVGVENMRVCFTHRRAFTRWPTCNPL